MANETLQDHRLTEVEEDCRELRAMHKELMEKLGTFIDAHNANRVSVTEKLVQLEERQNSLQRIVYGAIGALVTMEIVITAAVITAQVVD